MPISPPWFSFPPAMNCLLDGIVTKEAPDLARFFGVKISRFCHAWITVSITTPSIDQLSFISVHFLFLRSDATHHSLAQTVILKVQTLSSTSTEARPPGISFPSQQRR